MSDVLKIERHGAHVAVLTIDRPKSLNALNPAVMEALDAAITELEADSDVRAVVLQGGGDKAFVAGADISAMQGYTPVEAEHFAASGQNTLARLASARFAVIAAVQGFALGGGCELAMACDLILAGPRARFGQPEVNLGVIPGFGGTQRLVRRVGMSHALDLCLTGRMVKADEAMAMGLCSQILDDVKEGALKVAAQIASKGPVAVHFCKRAIHENADQDVLRASAAERTLFAMCFSTEDQSEGMTAFLEKRAAKFTGA